MGVREAEEEPGNETRNQGKEVKCHEKRQGAKDPGKDIVVTNGSSVCIRGERKGKWGKKER